MQRKYFSRMCALLLLMAGICFLLAGCNENHRKGKVRDLECTVLEEEQIPQALKEVIEENKEKEMKLSYRKDGVLYIARGFGRQKTAGYSISVTDLYLAEDGIHIHTQLQGPEAGEKPVEKETYPYIVISMEDLEETIIFQ